MPLRGRGRLLVDDDDAGRNTRAIKQICGQTDNALDVALANEIAADVSLGVATEEDAVRQDACTFAGAFERADDVQQVGVVALLGWRSAKGLETVVRFLLQIEACAPPLVRERWIRNNVIEGLECAAVCEFWTASVLPAG